MTLFLQVFGQNTPKLWRISNFDLPTPTFPKAINVIALDSNTAAGEFNHIMKSVPVMDLWHPGCLMTRSSDCGHNTNVMTVWQSRFNLTKFPFLKDYKKRKKITATGNYCCMLIIGRADGVGSFHSKMNFLDSLRDSTYVHIIMLSSCDDKPFALTQLKVSICMWALMGYRNVWVRQKCWNCCVCTYQLLQPACFFRLFKPKTRNAYYDTASFPIAQTLVIVAQ